MPQLAFDLEALGGSISTAWSAASSCTPAGRAPAGTGSTAGAARTGSTSTPPACRAATAADHLWREQVCKHILAALLREGDERVLAALRDWSSPLRSRAAGRLTRNAGARRTMRPAPPPTSQPQHVYPQRPGHRPCRLGRSVRARNALRARAPPASSPFDESNQVTLAPAPLQSRFGRRLLLLFVGCAVLPIAVVAAVVLRARHPRAPRPERAPAAAGQQGHGPRRLRAPAPAGRHPQEHSAQRGATSSAEQPSRPRRAGCSIPASTCWRAGASTPSSSSATTANASPVFGRLARAPDACVAADRENLRLGPAAHRERCTGRRGLARMFMLRRSGPRARCAARSSAR